MWPPGKGLTKEKESLHKKPENIQAEVRAIKTDISCNKVDHRNDPEAKTELRSQEDTLTIHPNINCHNNITRPFIGLG